MRYPAYSEYKNIDVGWLGSIPKEWSAQRIRFIVRTNPVKSEIANIAADDFVSFVPMEAVGELGGITLESEKLLSDVYNGYTYFKDGDIVIAKITPCFENGKGAIVKGLTNGIGFGTTEFHVLRPNTENNRRFIFYLSMSHPFRKIGESEMLGAGGQKRISESFIKNFCVGLPSKDEQEGIANFLDYKTQQIDQLIEKKKALIEKLGEQRIAVITQAVTKGLDKNAKMKPSGVDWLGDVPEHWGVLRAKFVSSIFVPQRNKPKLNSSTGIFWATMDDMKSDFINETKLFVEELEAEVAGSKILKSGAVIASCVGNFGVASINNTDVIINQQLQAFIPVSIKGDYLKEVVLISSRYFELVGTAATLIYVNQLGFECMPVPLPSQQEQEEIVEYLKKEKKRIEKMKLANQQVIHRLEEYRAALITSVVTGKIDVRNAVIPAKAGI